MKVTLAYRLEALAFKAWIALCRALPLDAASALGGSLGRWIGPYLPAHRTALSNLALAYPDMREQERKRIAMDMWEHLGRVGAEFPVLPGTRLTERVQYEGLENLPPSGTQVFFMSGHIGNWETLYSLPHKHSHPVTLIYRHANNPLVDAMICALRASQCRDMFPKGRHGATRLGRALKSKHSIAMLVDQKMNTGIPVPFFGHPAMTAPAIAEMSMRFCIPILPVRSIRTQGAHFRVILYPALPMPDTGDHEQDVRSLMTDINALLESWIREYPAQWFWVHKRWPQSIAAT